MDENMDKMFNDSVHGCICMPPLCMKIIDTPEFQRLRFVKQLGCGYFVYPGASHNRFEHCIGVSHLAGKFIEALKRHERDLIDDRDVLCVKVAGLCHDLGHGPFSHLWDRFISNLCRPGDEEYKHENISCEMLAYLLQQNEICIEDYSLLPHDFTFIKALILGERDTSGTGRDKKKTFLYDIVSNSRNGIDVDKWDYLLRDSHHLGIPVIFSYERLIRYARVKQVPNEGSQICFREKVAGDVMDMFSVRYELHKKAYQHRVSHKITYMLLDAFAAADPHVNFDATTPDGTKRRYKLSDCHKNMGAFSQLTDDLVQRILSQPVDGREDLASAQQIIRNIYHRKLYKDVGQAVLPQGSSYDWGQTVKDTMVERLREGTIADTDEAIRSLKVTKAEMDYGSKGSFPMQRVRFFSKGGEIISPELIPPALFPTGFKTTFLRILSTSDDAEVCDHLKAAFSFALLKHDLREIIF